MRGRNLMTRYYVCPICKTVLPLPIKHGNEHKSGHKKNLFCPVCRYEGNFSEKKEFEICKTLADIDHM